TLLLREIACHVTPQPERRRRAGIRADQGEQLCKARLLLGAIGERRGIAPYLLHFVDSFRIRSAFELRRRHGQEHGDARQGEWLDTADLGELERPGSRGAPQSRQSRRQVGWRLWIRGGVTIVRAPLKDRGRDF